jgi:hypothetical protein
LKEEPKLMTLKLRTKIYGSAPFVNTSILILKKKIFPDVLGVKV